MLSVRDLCKSFGGLAAVQHIDFNVAPGSITALIGPNGAGKSTVFNLISGALRPDSGEVSFEGADVTGLSAHQLARRGVARSFQITNLFAGLTVRENVELACLSRRRRSQFLWPTSRFTDLEAEVHSHTAAYGLSEHVNDVVRDLSHGDQRRLEVALCMARRPKLLMLDEPTQGMGPTETAEFEQLIRSLRTQVSVLLVEHDVELVMGISDVVIVLQQGIKIAEGTPEQVRQNQAVRDAYLGGEE